jgi:hypothetical protein
VTKPDKYTTWLEVFTWIAFGGPKAGCWPSSARTVAVIFASSGASNLFSSAHPKVIWLITTAKPIVLRHFEFILAISNECKHVSDLITRGEVDPLHDGVGQYFGISRCGQPCATRDKSRLFNALMDTKVSTDTIVLSIRRRGFSVIAAVFCISCPIESDMCKRSSFREEHTMIDVEETEYSATIHNKCGNDGGHRSDDGIRGACAGNRCRPARSGVQITALVGERWKASMRRACIPAPYAATLVLRSAWYAPGQSWMRPARVYRVG